MRALRSSMDCKAPNRAVKKIGKFIATRLVTGVLVAAPIYLAGLLLLKVAKSLAPVARPIAKILPAWLPAERVLSVLLVLFACFLFGLTIGSPRGRAAWERIENSICRKIPGYALIRGFTQRLAGQARDQAWRPALAEIEQGLVPAFIIEELADGRFTVFVPSVPTPLSGAIYILGPDRVHPLDISLTHVLKTVSQWGLGAKDLAAAMERKQSPSGDTTSDDVRKVA